MNIDLKFDTDSFDYDKTYRDRLIGYIKMDMSNDDRSYMSIKIKNNLLLYAGYVADVESSCTKRRAIASICGIGADVLYGLEISVIDKDKHDEYRSKRSKMLTLNRSLLNIVNQVIADQRMFVIDGGSTQVHIWNDVYGFVYGFADRYNLGNSSVAAMTFWLGLDKLISHEEMYSFIGDFKDAVLMIEYAKSIPAQINDFNHDMVRLSDMC